MNILKKITWVACLATFFLGNAQTYNQYTVSFKNVHQHLAQVELELDNLDDKVLELRMSRTSPGRYAIHEFAKNVFEVNAVDQNGKPLKITRPNPYAWHVANHEGYAKISYTIFANHADGTYAQIDESHAHLNMPATFMYAKDYEHRPIQIQFNTPKQLNWKVATQLMKLGDYLYYAPNLQYFMDSPTELSNHMVKSFDVKDSNGSQKITLALHHQGTQEEVDQYFEQVKKVVIEQQKVFGELPKFDFGEYTFIACYMPQVDGDGMEHRNSTILTSTQALAKGGFKSNIGTVSHEFFHAWNVERIRPQSLEPFSFEQANMSGELWFAEGFTSYYTRLILCRAGLISPQQYISGLAGALNYVWLSPARQYFNPIEMSYQAPFVDAATSVDPVNRTNTFISYYSYGSVLGLALDLSLRQLDQNKSLDGYMQLVWNRYGKQELSYTVKDLESTLKDYAGATFANHFFKEYVFNSHMPGYKALFDQVGVSFHQEKTNQPKIGAYVKANEEGWLLAGNLSELGAASLAGLSSGDLITKVNETVVNNQVSVFTFLENYKPGEALNISYKRFGKAYSTKLILQKNQNYTTQLKDKLSKKEKNKLEAWLHQSTK